GALSQQRMNQYPALGIHRRLLAVVVSPVKELASRRIHRRQERQTLFDGVPFRHRVNPDAITRQTGHIERGSVLVLHVTLEDGWNFEPPLGIDPSCVVAAYH